MGQIPFFLPWLPTSLKSLKPQEDSIKNHQCAHCLNVVFVLILIKPALFIHIMLVPKTTTGLLMSLHNAEIPRRYFTMELTITSPVYTKCCTHKFFHLENLSLEFLGCRIPIAFKLKIPFFYLEIENYSY